MTLPMSRRTALIGLGALAVPPALWAKPNAAPPTAKPVAAAAAAGLPAQRLAPGGIAHLALGSAPQRPQVTTNEGAPVLVVGETARWTALLGIELSAPLGKAAVQVQREGQAPERIGYSVGAHRYPEQRLQVAPGHVDLSAENAARAARERKHLAGVMASFSEPFPAQLIMRPPVPGRRSSSFGLRRVFNGQPRSPHSGMDIAAGLGTPVHAPLAGRVIDTGDYFFAGNSVWLDHGGGLLSLLCHLSEFRCQVGDVVPAGQVVALVGATGRVTGPHLHWGVCLTGTMVDPALLLGEEHTAPVI